MYNKPEEKDYTLYILGIIIAAGFVLRFFNLGFNSVWMDEAVTALHSSGTLESIWTSMTGTLDYNPPFFFLLEWIVIKLFGITEWSLRLLPAFFGALAVPITYLAGKEFKDKYVGLIAAAIISFSPFLIYYSQEARPYTMVLFLCSLLMYFFLKGLKENESIVWIAFGITSAAIFYTHFYGLVFVGILWLFALIKYIKTPLRIINGAIIGTIISTPLIFAAYSLYFQRTASPVTYGSNGIYLIPDTIIQMFGYIGRSVVAFGESYSILLFLILGFLGMLWLFYKDKEKFALMVWILGLTFAISIAASNKIPMLPRYLLFLMVPASLIIGSTYQMFANMFQQRNPKIIAIVFVILFFVAAIPFYSSYYTSSTRDDWKTVGRDLSDITQDGDTVIVAPRYANFALDFYYSSSKDKTTEVGVMSVEEMLSVPKSGSVFYIMTGDIAAADPSGSLQHWLETNTRLVKQYGNIVIARG